MAEVRHFCAGSATVAPQKRYVPTYRTIYAFRQDDIPECSTTTRRNAFRLVAADKERFIYKET
jgi:hypothetical protein